MIVEKTALDELNCYNKELFYPRARNGMHEIIQLMAKQGYIDTILLPGYIGWSPKEGSGIFDSISGIEKIKVKYYQMSENLLINKQDLYQKINSDKCLVLLVNYFGFRDPDIEEIVHKIKCRHAWILEDNAHGFYTYHLTHKIASDATVFSLHKMLPFKEGGSLIIHNSELKQIGLNGISAEKCKCNPYNYDIFQIAEKRKNNFRCLSKLLTEYEMQGIVKSLKREDDLKNNVPQSFPIIICKGDRNKVYKIMNENGYGVVSLYHTLIEPLQKKEFQEALKLSKYIINLPVHQDVNISTYPDMVQMLIGACQISESEMKSL